MTANPPLALPRPGLWDRLGRVDPRYLISFLITLVLVVGELRYGILGGYERLAITLAVCVGTELVLSGWQRGKFASIQSAYISGISLALLLKPQTGLLWPFALGSFLAIASKYVLTYRNQHLWNPSNFAIAVLLVLAPGSVAILSHQWGNHFATNAVIWVFGLVIAARVRVLHVTLAYVAAFLALAALRSALAGTVFLVEAAPITGPMYQLFIFFMVTDPRTTVSTRNGRIGVVLLVALVEALIRFAGDRHIAVFGLLYPAPPILALAMVGPVAKWIDLRSANTRSGRFRETPSAPATEPS